VDAIRRLQRGGGNAAVASRANLLPGGAAVTALQPAAGNRVLAAMLQSPRGRTQDRRSHAGIQRALATATPVTRDDLRTTAAANPKALVAHTHGEVVTDSWGADSSTLAFTHANDSNLLEIFSAPISYRGERIGLLRPMGRRTPRWVSGVKMHMVNSFLHSDANTWAENWVWGHKDLNTEHDHKVESLAKQYHPANPARAHLALATGELIEAMGYRVQKRTPAGVGAATADSLADEIVERIMLLAPTPAWIGPSRESVLDPALFTIAGLGVATYFARWAAAVAATVASEIDFDLRLYGSDPPGAHVATEDIPLDPISDPDPVEFTAWIEKSSEWLADDRRGLLKVPRDTKRVRDRSKKKDPPKKGDSKKPPRKKRKR
jgi:hypothetical protein